MIISARKRLVRPMLFLLLVMAAGCGTDKLAPVRGKVYYQGAALRGGTIVFIPDALRGGNGPLARAEIQPDGGYTMRTGEDTGAVTGWHRVTIMAVEPTGSALPGQGFVVPRSLVPEKYRDPELSGLLREVRGGRENIIDFHLE